VSYSPIPASTPTLLARFWKKVDKTDDGCWLWKGATGSKGYGSMGWGPRGAMRSYLAHRLAYHWLVAPLDPSLTVDHLCYERRCVRPDHLEAVSLAENMRRSASWDRRLQRLVADRKAS
jgi:hypothetical protein